MQLFIDSMKCEDRGGYEVSFAFKDNIRVARGNKHLVLIPSKSQERLKKEGLISCRWKNSKIFDKWFCGTCIP